MGIELNKIIIFELDKNYHISMGHYPKLGGYLDCWTNFFNLRSNFITKLHSKYHQIQSNPPKVTYIYPHHP